MKIYQTEAVFLRSFPLSESDKIVSCLTPEYGMIRLVAKGARKLKSRFSGTLEPFTIADIAFYRREDAELGVLRQVELRRSYFHLARKIELITAFSYFGELLGEFAPPGEANHNLYRMARSCFEAISAVIERPEKVRLGVLYFELWLLRLNGYLPDIRFCGNCRRPLKSVEVIVWAADNRFSCAACETRGGVVLKPVQNSLMRSARRLSPAEFIAEMPGEREALNPLEIISRKLIRQILARDLEYWSEKNWEATGL